MAKHPLHLVVFLLGLAVIVWIGLGYLPGNPLALAVTLLIAAGYGLGAWELLRYRQATDGLAAAVDGLSEAPPALDAWLDRLDPSLRGPVRLRIEGERSGLPVPALAPALVGLLVLLGMLGTLLGMMATLRGTGMALETATDLQAIRDSLAAPVKGLGFAFGTSIAGIATSAMLGLLAALCRRGRLAVAQRLDAKIATVLHVHSQAHRRAQTLQLMQQQTALMPLLIERLQAMTASVEQQARDAHARQAASQDDFHGRTEAAYVQLAASVERTLQASVADGARAASEALQPVMRETMAAIARETATLQAGVDQAVQRQLDALSTGFQATTADVAALWRQSVAEQQQANAALAGDLRGSLADFNRDFAERATELLDGARARLDAAAQQTDALRATVEAAVERQLQSLAAGLDTATGRVTEGWQHALADQQAGHARLAEELRAILAGTGEAFAERTTGLIDGVAARLDATAGRVAGAWQDALAQQGEANQALVASHREAMAAAAATFEGHAGALLQAVDASHAQLQAALAEQDRARLAAWTDSLAAMGAALREDWERAGNHAATQQQAVCDTLAKTAQAIAEQTGAHASGTIAEISRLVETASEAPRAAADVVAELRQALSESMVRDTAMLEERTQLLGTLDTLLGAITHASTEQRGAIDALVAGSAELLERVGSRFTDHIAAETGKLDASASQVAVGAVEVASLGEAFGAAVQAFGESNAHLAGRLERIEDALAAAMARSDEQLAYYVAQAREMIDLSLLTQTQIVEDLQRLAGQPAVAGDGAA